MVKGIVNLNNETGLHARPASELAKTACKYNSEIKLNVNGKVINAKSVLNIMAAGIKQNTEIEIICKGDDEEKAFEKVQELFMNNFGE